MNWKACASIALIAASMISCGNNAESETTVITDTTALTPDTVLTTLPDTTATVSVDVPEKTKSGFEKKYPKASNVKWESHKKETRGVEWDLADWPEVDEGGRNAWFHWEGNDRKAFYDDKGDWVGTVDNISNPSALPAAVTKSLNREFNGYKVTSITRENDKNRTAYEITLEKGSERIKALIDENGNVVKKKTVK